MSWLKKLDTAAAAYAWAGILGLLAVLGVIKYWVAMAILLWSGVLVGAVILIVKLYRRIASSKRGKP